MRHSKDAKYIQKRFCGESSEKFVDSKVFDNKVQTSGLKLERENRIGEWKEKFTLQSMKLSRNASGFVQFKLT